MTENTRAKIEEARKFDHTCTASDYVITVDGSPICRSDGSIRIMTFDQALRIMKDDPEPTAPIDNIFQTNYSMPETVYIVATGPNGRDHLAKIPSGAYVIAVNGAVLIPDRISDITWRVAAWVVGDWRATEKEYWRTADRTFRGVRIFSDQVIDKHPIQGTKSQTYITGLVRTALDDRDHWTPASDAIRPDCTVVGAALDVAYRKGARRTVLVGADMSGDDYYDGTRNPSVDHGDTWSQRDRLDEQIRWMQDHGCQVESMSDTRLQNCDPWSGPGDTEYPSVGYLIMSFDPMNTRRAIINAAIQDYPGEKIVYVMQQEPFAGAIDHDLDIELHQVNVDGEWPAVWGFKLMQYFISTRAEITILWDEDDMFDPDYTWRAIEPIHQGICDLTWNHENVIVKRDSMSLQDYRSAIGTIAGRTSVLRESALALMEKYPDGTTDGVQGPVDAKWKSQIKTDYADRLQEHTGRRYYFFHSGAQTTGARKIEECADYAPGTDQIFTHSET
jgi:hypothetical protein